MVSLYSHRDTAVVDAVPSAIPASETAQESNAPETAAESSEFEIVLGWRQMSSILFVAVVVIVCFSAFAYLVGRSATPRAVSGAAPATPIPATATPAAPAPTVQATLARPRSRPEPELFATPVPNKIYIQMAAVEKGLAIIFAEGLRHRGLDGFVAPAPNEKLFRVLIGPLPDEASYTRVKN